jgi:magnesium-protoporphyrin O-methyltransferase
VLGAMSCGAGCCGVQELFDETKARADLEKFRRRGPSPSTKRLLASLRATGAPMATLLDVGGGIGSISHALLASGTAEVTLVDGSSAHLDAARDESERRGTTDRLRLRPGDIVEMADGVSEADVVTLDKVVCCYADMSGLLAVSAARARRLFGIVYPRDAWWVRAAIVVDNWLHARRGPSLRGYAHSNAAIDGALQGAGLALRARSGRLWWVVAVWERR